MYDLVFMSISEVALHHLLRRRGQVVVVRPPEHFPSPRSISEQDFNLGGAVVPWIHLNDAAAGLGVVPLFVDSFAFPSYLNASGLERHIDEVMHGCRVARRQLS